MYLSPESLHNVERVRSGRGEGEETCRKSKQGASIKRKCVFSPKYIEKNIGDKNVNFLSYLYKQTNKT